MKQMEVGGKCNFQSGAEDTFCKTVNQRNRYNPEQESQN